MDNVKTFGVLAGAYRGGRKSLKNILLHSATVNADGNAVKVLCSLPMDSLCGDRYGISEDKYHGLPTCPKCLAKLGKR